MNESGKGIVVASVVLGISLIICTLLLLGGMRKFQNNAFGFVKTQKKDVIEMLRAQKKDIKKFEWNREGRIKNFIRDELKKMNIDVQKSAT